jgi:nucleotide-binding universal stress UspA family protein
MTATHAEALVKIKNVLFLTDFSRASETAQAFAVAMARKYVGTVEGLHVLTPIIPESCPEAIAADEDLAEAEMQKVKLRMGGVASATIMSHERSVWAAVERAIRENHVDLIVAGTHGRTGAPRLLLGSVAEEIFRRSPVPVLTVGPASCPTDAKDIRFDRVLFATDFSPESEAATPYALSLAREKHAQLVLLHVMRKPAESVRDHDRSREKQFEVSVAEAINKLYQMAPNDAVYNPPEVTVEYGEPAERIVEAAKERGADLIVLGIRSAAHHLGAATHLERPTAHKVVVHAHCPVITVRTSETAYGERTCK